MKSLKGRVAVVTGAGSGIGAAVARRLAADGACVTVADLDRSAADSVAAELAALDAESLVIETDVGRQEQVERMIADTVDRWGRVDILVNNAWGSRVGMLPVQDLGTQALQSAFEVGTLGCYWSMCACYPHMEAAGYGRIISMCSLNGVNAHRYTAHYNMAKEGLRAITRTAAREWAATGITCNIVCPSAETSALNGLRAANPELFDSIEKTLPMQRFGDADRDVAPVVAFLASEESRFVTGNTIHVDGGGHINGVAWDPGEMLG